MLHRTALRVLICCAICVAFSPMLGCPQRGAASRDQQQSFVAYADLPGLKNSHHVELQAEYARLLAERATPLLLDADAHTAASGSRSVDIGSTLDKAFNASAIDFAMRRSDRLLGDERFKWDPISLEHAFRLRQQYDRQRIDVRTALAQPSARFEIELSQGVGLDIAFAEAALIYTRMELFYAAEQITLGDVSGASQTLASLLSMCQLLGENKHVVSRLTAARARHEALAIVEAIAAHSATSSTQLEQLRQTIDGQLSNWPDDADCWIGDRAQGMHVYEMIRDGNLLSVMTEDEFTEYAKDKQLDAFVAAASRSIDSDEAFYLRSMRSIVDACQRPYYQRAATFTALREQLAALQKTPEYPLIADRLLLQEIEPAQRQQALDRAWMEAWANALALACDERDAPFLVNPLSGRPYAIEFENGRVSVLRIDPTDPQAKISVPFQRAERVSRGESLPPPR